MKILIDIGHPAHVHYFRNFIHIMKGKGHEFLITARNRSMIHYLLKHYDIPFYDRGKGKNSVIGKLLYMVYADLNILKKALSFKPDFFISFASPYAALVSWLLHKPHIVLDDTEHAKFGHMFYKPFSSVFLNPSCFYKHFGKKQIFFNSLTECFYLHKSFFTPNKNIYQLLGLSEYERYVILRFVSWQANHDLGHSGLNKETKLKLVEFLSMNYKVFISPESELNNDYLDKYIIKIPPEYMHDALFFADFFITESGTMASEAAVLGTPVIYVNSLPLMGYLKEEQQNGLLFHFTNSSGVIELSLIHI